jgi:hypothetical protein
MPPLPIGWKEYAEFPEWGLRRIKVKIDTGARTSALGAEEFQVLPAEHGSGELVELHLRLNHRRRELVTVIRMPVVRRVRVRNSGGQTEVRPAIATLIRIGPVTKRVTFTVTRRPRMLVPVLIGRAALADDFLVDAGRKFLLTRRRSI